MLFILDRAGERAGRDAPDDAIKVIKAEMRVQAIDFWIRNPDYLAFELLDQYEQSGKSDDALLEQAEQVMEGDEPELRRLGMLRYLFGAYEALDDAMATLSLSGLALLRRDYREGGIAKTFFYLTETGQSTANQLAANDALRWYAERADLVARVAGKRNGSTLKNRQYKIAEYNNARHGRIIQPIHREVRARLAKVRDRS
ncbi:MAG: hypothetical protein HZA66_18755 [Rhodopseudomonas palustris]|uniref:Uncharacterized protein n=1 Tax=Rhodopseudomonas palustris TaxID=1076 RepID=A0A933VWX7_RHOPL|nr:hypothetical protein [Rhodopseudomonas palustris]